MRVLVVHNPCWRDRSKQILIYNFRSFFYQKPEFKYFVKFDRDAMTNIVVVQFVSDIQTNMDIKYNLTCVTRGPGSATVTSGLIGAGYRESFFFYFLKR